MYLKGNTSHSAQSRLSRASKRNFHSNRIPHSFVSSWICLSLVFILPFHETSTYSSESFKSNISEWEFLKKKCFSWRAKSRKFRMCKCLLKQWNVVGKELRSDQNRIFTENISSLQQNNKDSSLAFHSVMNTDIWSLLNVFKILQKIFFLNTFKINVLLPPTHSCENEQKATLEQADFWSE